MTKESASEPWNLAGEKYSPNLRKWAKKNAACPSHDVYTDASGTLWIGWIDDGRWFVGSRLWRVLTFGRKAEVGCWMFPVSDLTLLESFWAEYEAIGRCAIDRGHSRHFGDETRWSETGETRSCKWCGNARQGRVRWTESVPRERWIDLPVKEAEESV